MDVCGDNNGERPSRARCDEVTERVGEDTKAARKTTTDTDLPIHSYQALLTHLGTLTRNQVRFADTPTAVALLAETTDTQRQAFQLLHATIPLTLQ